MSRPGEAFGIHFGDQVAAAIRDAASVVDHYAVLGERARRVPSPWHDELRERMRDVASQLVPCRHVARGPQVAYWPIWAGARLVCGPCLDGVRLRPGSAADRTCDRCGHVCPDRAGQRIRPGAANFGPILAMFGLCPPCSRLALDGAA